MRLQQLNRRGEKTRFGMSGVKKGGILPVLDGTGVNEAAARRGGREESGFRDSSEAAGTHFHDPGDGSKH